MRAAGRSSPRSSAARASGVTSCTATASSSPTPDLGGRIERVVVLGHPTLSREVAALLGDPDVEVLALRGPGEPLNLNGATTPLDTVGVAPGDTDREWLGAWLRASRAASVDLTPRRSRRRRARLRRARASGWARSRPSSTRSARRSTARRLVDAVWRATWPHDRLVFGSSRLVRVADAVLGGKKVPVHANRGLAGIDGTIATAFGIALASQSGGRAGVTRVAARRPRVPARRRRAAARLRASASRASSSSSATTAAARSSTDSRSRRSPEPRRWTACSTRRTPSRLEQLALAYGWEYKRVATRAALDQALTSAGGGAGIIEVPLAR